MVHSLHTSLGYVNYNIAFLKESAQDISCNTALAMVINEGQLLKGARIKPRINGLLPERIKRVFCEKLLKNQKWRC